MAHEPRIDLGMDVLSSQSVGKEKQIECYRCGGQALSYIYQKVRIAVHNQIRRATGPQASYASPESFPLLTVLTSIQRLRDPSSDPSIPSSATTLHLMSRLAWPLHNCLSHNITLSTIQITSIQACVVVEMPITTPTAETCPSTLPPLRYIPAIETLKLRVAAGRRDRRFPITQG